MAGTCDKCSKKVKDNDLTEWDDGEMLCTKCLRREEEAEREFLREYWPEFFQR